MTNPKNILLFFALILMVGCNLFTETEKDSENNAPIAENFTVTMLEEGTYSINQSELGSDEDGEKLTFKVTSTSNVDATFENNQLVITGRLNYFGTAMVNYSVSDGDKSTNGVITAEITNVTDNPIAIAGSDRTGVIDQDITLNGSGSIHPDSPLSQIISYEWNVLNGTPQLNNETQENSTFTSNTKGEYEVELFVTDDKGAVGRDTVNVNITSYSLIVNTTNVLDDTDIGGLEVTINGKSAITDNDGRAEIEFDNDNVNGVLLIRDENGVGIGDYFNYSDTLDIGTGLEVIVEMVPKLEFESQFYTDIFDFLTQMIGYAIIGYQPGDWLQDYPILVDYKRDEMPMAHYNQAVEESIQHINNTLGWDVFRETTGDDAKYVFDYSKINSSFGPDFIQINGNIYINEAIAYITKSVSENFSEYLKGQIVHELFTHGLGWIYHSLDNKDISYAPPDDSNITNNEKNAKIINLKLNAGTDLNNYLID